MSVVSTIYAVGSKLPRSEFDDQGYTSHNPIFPERAELIYAASASIIVFAALAWKAGPLIKKALADRTARIQDELDRSATAKADAQAEAERIREAKGDIEAERQRIFAEADAQAEALVTDGRARLEDEVAELEARAEAEIAAAASRSGDELRAEIARNASAAADRVVVGSLDDAIRQELIENFITRVGATAS